MTHHDSSNSSISHHDDDDDHHHHHHHGDDHSSHHHDDGASQASLGARSVARRPSGVPTNVTKRSEKPSAAHGVSQATTPDIVKFNVGGTLYHVSRSLLNSHPNCMLTRMASEQWHPTENDPTAELFVERHGQRFACVLDYLRDARVSLPHGIAKRALMDDLRYFNIDFDASALDDSAQVAQGYARGVKRMHQEIEHLTENAQLSLLAKLCIERYLAGISSCKGRTDTNTFTLTYVGDSEHYNAARRCHKGGDAARKKCNAYLDAVGLEIKSTNLNSDCRSIRIEVQLKVQEQIDQDAARSVA